MEFNPLPTQNWSRTFNVWIEDIQVRFQPVIELERALIHGGFLRRVRSLTRFSAVLVTVFFTIHCTRARVTPPPPAPQGFPTGGYTDNGYSEVGEASWYGGEGDGFEGKPTANGEIYDPSHLTCAHRTLPLGTLVQVENLDNGRKTLLRVNDRGPFIRGRILDCSRQGAKDLGFLGQGVARVRVKAVNSDGTPAVLGAPANSDEAFTVQVAALSDPANLERLSRELEQSIGPVNLQDALGRDGRNMKRVRVGSFARFEEAQKTLEAIVKRFGDRGVEPFITRRR